MKFYSKFFLFILLTCFFSCNPSPSKLYLESSENPILLHDASNFLTQIVVYDIFKPPVASRIYAYSYLAAYEALRLKHPEFPDLAGKLNGFKGVTQGKNGVQYDYPLVSMKAFLTVGKKFTFSPEIWVDFEKTYFLRFQKMDIPKEVYNASIELGNQIGNDIIDYAKGDGYIQTRGIGYALKRSPGSWEPTPPGYADACEPLWNTLRTFTLTHPAQFFPAPPTPFSLDTQSPFYKMNLEVYYLSKSLTQDQKEIAYFWDDNAFVSQVKGHFMSAEKKMTPSGHWTAITQTLCKAKKRDMMTSAQAYCYASLAMYDAFIGSWDVKYKTSRIRPITVIRKTLDPNWFSFLETPGFPEYDSGHSCISAASGIILVHLFGDQTAFTDSTESYYGHGVRSFKSISEAYKQVSLSRVYGGIHYWESVNQGMIQGQNTGEWVWNKIMNP